MSYPSKEPKDPAFPTATYSPHSGTMNGHYTGITVRDYFAAKAMTVLMTEVSKANPEIGPEAVFFHVATKAYQQADEMLKQRQKDGDN